jgi:hypothetical protein
MHIISSSLFTDQELEQLVGTVTGYRLGGQGIGARFKARTMGFYPLYSSQTGSGTRPASYPMGISGSLSL